MRKITLLLLGTTLTVINLKAQSSSGINGPAKVVFAELAGPGLLSVNYDMRLTNANDGFGFRIGVGGWSLNKSKLLLVPLGVNYITSKNNRDYFEVGAGATIVNNSNTSTSIGPFKSSFGFLSMGYRKQPADGGYFFKAALMPIFGSGYFWPYYAGVGFGYAF